MENSNEKLTEKRTFESIDLVKFICSILVIGIHMPLFGMTEAVVLNVLNYGIARYVARLAVPFFFMCTGFLLFRKKTESGELKNGIRYAKKTYRLYLIWTLIYLYPIVQNILSHKKGVLAGLGEFVRNTVFIGSYTHLWYLNAAAFAVLLVAFLLHKGVCVRKIIGTSLVLYLIGVLPQSYYGLFGKLESVPVIWKVVKMLEKIMGTTRNGLFTGFFFVSLGMLFAKMPVRLSVKQAWMGFAGSMLLWLGEILMLVKLNWIREWDMYVFMIPAAFFLFCAVLRTELKNRRIYRELRDMSALIYFVHLWVRFIVGEVYGAMNLPASIPDARGLITVIGSAAVAFGIVRLSKCKRFGWMKKLYA